MSFSPGNGLFYLTYCPILIVFDQILIFFRTTLARIVGMMVVLACTGCPAQPETSVPTAMNRNPSTPPQDSLDQICSIAYDSLQRIPKSHPDSSDLYLLRKARFSGWACHIFSDTEHKFRYTQYDGGVLIWQIGYYANGQLDHDFRMRQGKSMGSERMWRGDGHPYIDYYYSAPGVPHGIHRRWHTNNMLAREALFEHGLLIYEHLYDQNGKLLESKGMGR